MWGMEEQGISKALKDATILEENYYLFWTETTNKLKI